VSGSFGIVGGWGLELGARFLSSTRTDPTPADIGIGLTAGSLGMSYAPLDEEVRLALGAGALLGAMHLSVHSPTPVADGPGDYFWLALRAGPTLAVTLTRPVQLGLEADLVVPLTRHRFFVVDGEQPAFESASVGAMGALVVSVQSN
jgi:hypothetical protein